MSLGPEFIELDTVASTMIEAAERLAAGTLTPWTTILARHQTHGRGRIDRDWVNVPGQALLATVMVPMSIPWGRAGLIAIAAGTSIAGALHEWGVDVSLKWPNDVYLDSRKLGGVLIHTRLATNVIALIGIGINVTSAPSRFTQSAIALADVLVDPPTPRQLAESIVRHLQAAALDLESGKWQSITDAWTRRAMWINEHVSVVADTEVVGRFIGIDQFGRMLLDTTDGERSVATGDVRCGPRITD